MFLVIRFLRLIHSEIVLKEFTLAHRKGNEDQSNRPQGRGHFFLRDDKQDRDTIPMPTFAGRPSTVSSIIPVEFPHNSMVGQQRQQISELQFDKFLTPRSFWFGNTIQKSSDYLFRFSVGSNVVDQRSGNG